MSKIITISREFGSGGKYIGELVAKKLGIPCYDDAIVERVAEESGMMNDFVKKFGEYSPSKSLFAFSFVGRNSAGESIEDYLLKVQHDVIVNLAKQGPCVIVGRSADYILKGVVDTIDVFVYGDKKDKIERVMKYKNVSEDEAKKLIRDTDKKRSINYRYYTAQTWGDYKNYTLMINSTAIGIEAAAEMIAKLY